MELKYLTYEEFGAKGDGKTDDFDAIIACHNEANKKGLSVKAKDGATYYIGAEPKTAYIKTNVDFGKAKFIIDDTNVEISKRGADIFKVASENARFDIKIDKLKAGATHIDIPHEGNLYVRVFNENKRIFIRQGLNMNAGTTANDCFTVDEVGNIFPSVEWDYEAITKAYAVSIDDSPIVIKGGIFTTIANRAESFYNYHARGILVNRAHVTIENITHYVEGELDHGAPYSGFIRTEEVFDFTLKDSLLSPHYTYKTPSKIPGQLVNMGSYDINFNASIDVKCINVTQTIDIMDRRYWGIYGSNFCKNLYLENCILSRFDAHQGVSNVTIKDCTLGHQCLNLIGFGEALIENTYAYGGAFATLRSDYGSIWRGNITIKNCKWKPAGNQLNVISALNDGQHNFGYPCSMQSTLTIDGLHIYDEEIAEGTLHVLPTFDKNADCGKPYPYATTKVLKLSNLTTESGRECIVCIDESLYKNLEVIKN